MGTNHTHTQNQTINPTKEKVFSFPAFTYFYSTYLCHMTVPDKCIMVGFE